MDSPDVMPKGLPIMDVETEFLSHFYVNYHNSIHMVITEFYKDTTNGFIIA